MAPRAASLALLAALALAAADGASDGPLAAAARLAGCEAVIGDAAGKEAAAGFKAVIGDAAGAAADAAAAGAAVDEALECVLGAWLPEASGGRRGAGARPARASGQPPQRSFAWLLQLALGDLGGAPGPEDRLAVLGSSGGGGRAALEAYLATNVASVVAVEEELGLRDAAKDARQRAVEASEESGASGRSLELVHGGAVEQAARWRGASIVRLDGKAFQPGPALPAALELSWSLAQELAPGTVVLAVGARSLPGCHPGLLLARTLFVPLSWSSDTQHNFAHVYVVAPRAGPTLDSAVPSPWLSAYGADEEAAATAEFRKAAAAEGSQVSGDKKSLRVPMDVWADLGTGASWGSPAGGAASSSQAGRVRLARLLVAAERRATPGAMQGIGCAYCDSTHRRFETADAIWASRPHVESLSWEAWAEALESRAGGGRGGPGPCAWKEMQDLLDSSPVEDGRIVNSSEVALRRLLPSSEAQALAVLMLAVQDSEERRSLYAMDWLLGAAGPAICGARDASGRTPLHLAATPAAVSRLMRGGADADAADGHGDAALHRAAEGKSAALVQALLDHGAAVNARDGTGSLPLHRAAMLGDARVASALLAARAEADALDGTGISALHWAVRLQHDGLADALLSAGADPDKPDNRGSSALHLAAGRGSPTLAQRLLGARARPEARDASGRTPLELARAEGPAEVVAALELARAEGPAEVAAALDAAEPRRPASEEL